MIQSHIKTWNLKNKRVLVRADLNLPIVNNTIESDLRLEAFLPTLKLLLEKGAQVILTTHIGNPGGKADPSLSTHQLIPLLKPHCPDITFAPDIKTAQKESRTSVILLENLRFFSGEQTSDLSFAQDLASLGRYYVNDAFATLHRNDNSITLVPSLFDPNFRSCGLLVEKELSILTPLRDNPAHPCTYIIGGNKAATKIPYLASIQHADTLVLLPTISNTCMYAQNQPIGSSPFEQKEVEVCKLLLNKKSPHIVVPHDYFVASKTVFGPIRSATLSTIQPDDVIITIGPKTVAHLLQIIATSKTIFFNGFSGIESRPETLDPIKQLLSAIVQTNTDTIICGGNSIALAQKYQLLHEFTNYSTGGGATLAYLSGHQLPGLAYI